MMPFACKMCGHCCEGTGGIVLAAKDRVRLAVFLGISEAELLAEHAYEQNGKQYLQSGADGYCKFFREGTGCDVHPARPDVCRAWPFFRGNLIDPGSLAMAKEDCPGIAAQAGFVEFRAAGLTYLRHHGLLADMDENGAGAALKLDETGREAE